MFPNLYDIPLDPISIHALRVEGDFRCEAVRSRLQNFYPRPPGGGRQPAINPSLRAKSISIHALRVEGDKVGHRVRKQAINFYPRPPGGGRRLRLHADIPTASISIHALRVEGDACACTRIYRRLRFLSTPSGWRATAKTDKVFVCFCAKGRRICLFKTRKEKICRWRFKKDKFWVLIWCEGSGKSVCASASHCG